MTTKSFVIIGDGAAGLTAAQKLRERSPLAQITILSDDPHAAYYRAALTNYLLGELADNQVWAVPPSFFYDYRIERVLARVVAVDGAGSRVHLSTGQVMPFDQLLIASGAHARQPQFEGTQLDGVMTLRTLHDARVVLDTVTAGRLKRAVVVGGGPLGIEWAMAMLERRVACSVLVRGGRVMERELDATGSDLVVARMKQAGIDIRTQTEIHAAVQGSHGDVASVLTKQNETIPCEMVCVAIGAVPNSYFLDNSGITVGKRRGVVVDDHMKTNLPNVYAAGDVAERNGRLLQLWQPAQQQALVAAVNMTGGDDTYAPGMHYFATRLADLDFASVGVVHTEDGMEELLERSQKTGTMAYRKLLLRDGKLVGALMLGQRSENVRRAGRAFKRVIDKQIDVSSIKRSLFDKSFDLNSWLRGRALVTKPKPPPSTPQVDIAPVAQIRGTQMLNLAAGAAAAMKIDVGPIPSAPMLTIGLPLATAHVKIAVVEKVTAHLEGAGKTWLLDAHVISIGRGASCQVQLADVEVSQMHAQVTLHNEEHFIRDMGSSIGTWVNGAALAKAHRLLNGDTIQIGPTVLKYVRYDAKPVVREAEVAKRDKMHMLEVRRGPSFGLRFALTGSTFTVGREPQSQLRLDDVQVSRRHAVLNQHDESWFICDMHSSRGTFKNGTQLRPGEDVALQLGDQLLLGDSLLVLISAPVP
jgi:NADPH-dependent 2,4-dienoyl-CoA reductase/sulfur reductase-like enzyme/pSer/pThr/pTyr-binding forkhead associated (FHA) protein